MKDEEMAEEYCNETMCTVCSNIICEYKGKCTEWETRKRTFLTCVKEVKADCDFAFEGKDLEIKELKAQIEKMKSDVIKHFGEENNVLVARLLKEWEIKKWLE